MKTDIENDTPETLRARAHANRIEASLLEARANLAECEALTERSMNLLADFTAKQEENAAQLDRIDELVGLLERKAELRKTGYAALGEITANPAGAAAISAKLRPIIAEIQEINERFAALSEAAAEPAVECGPVS